MMALEYRVLHQTTDERWWAPSDPRSGEALVLGEDQALEYARRLKAGEFGADHGMEIVGIWIEERRVIDGEPMKWEEYGANS